MTPSLPYHDPFNVNILPDDDAPVLYCDQAILLPFLCDGGNYAYIATTPGCGREHFAAIAELYREQGARRALAAARAEHQGRAATYTETRTALRLDAAPAKPRRQRRPSIAKLVERAEKTGKAVTSITTPDGTIIHFDETKPSDASNPWLADLPKVKQ